MPILVPHHRYEYQPQPGSEIDRDDPLAAGLVGFWPGNEGSGGTLTDLAGGNHGVFQGTSPVPTWTTDSLPVGGYAVSYPNSTAAYVKLPDLSSRFASGQFTVAAWCRFTTLVAGERVFSARNGAGGFELFLNTAGGTMGGVAWTGSTQISPLPGGIAGGAAPAGSAHLHALVLDSANVLTCYTDGLTNGGIALGGPANIPASPLGWAIGRRADSAVSPMGGAIGPVYLWNRGLSSADLARLQRSSYPFVLAPPAVRYFPFASGASYAASVALGATSGLSLAAANALPATLGLAATGGFAPAAANALAGSVALAATSDFMAGLGSAYLAALGLGASAGFAPAAAAGLGGSLPLGATGGFAPAAANALAGSVALAASGGFAPGSAWSGSASVALAAAAGWDAAGGPGTLPPDLLAAVVAAWADAGLDASVGPIFPTRSDSATTFPRVVLTVASTPTVRSSSSSKVHDARLRFRCLARDESTVDAMVVTTRDALDGLALDSAAGGCLPLFPIGWQTVPDSRPGPGGPIWMYDQDFSARVLKPNPNP